MARSRSIHCSVSMLSLPFFSLPDEIEEVSDLFCLNIFPCGFEERLFQTWSVVLDGSTATVADQNHDVAQNTTCTLFNQCGRSRTALTLSPGEMGVLAKWEKHFNRGEQVLQAGTGILLELEKVISAPFDFFDSPPPANGIGRCADAGNFTKHAREL